MTMWERIRMVLGIDRIPPDREDEPDG